MNENHQLDVNGVPKQKAQEFLEGLDAEARNLNNKKIDGSELASEVKGFSAAGKSGATPEASESLHRVYAQMAKIEVRNADNEGLGATNFCGILEGHVFEVNGGLAEEVPSCVPTRYELMELVKYWTKLTLDIEFFYFRYRITGSSDVRRATFSERRVARIENLLGKDLVEFAIEEAYVEYGKVQDPRTWNIFLNGTPEEQKASRTRSLGKSAKRLERSQTREYRIVTPDRPIEPRKQPNLHKRPTVA